MVLRKAQGRLSLATPGFEDACDVDTIFISLATGNVTSAALLVSGPATANALSSPASLRRLLVACAGLVASSRIAMRSFAPLMPPPPLTCFSSIWSVTVLARPHSAKGPLLGTIAPSTISRSACWENPGPATAAVNTAPTPTAHSAVLKPDFMQVSPLCHLDWFHGCSCLERRDACRFDAYRMPSCPHRK